MSVARGVQGKRTPRGDCLGRKEFPMFRNRAAAMIRQSGIDARIPEGKADACALRRLWTSIRAGIESNMELLVERRPEQGQPTVGWDI